MYAMADQFGVSCLKKTAAGKFERRCGHEGWDDSWDSNAEWRTLLDCVETVFTSTPDTDHTLRRCLTTAVVSKLKMQKNLISTPQFRERCLLFPDFAYSIVRADLLGSAPAPEEDRGGTISGGWTTQSWNGQGWDTT